MHELLTALTIPGWERHDAPTGAATIGVLHGEGIGPEVVDGTLAVLEAVVSRTADDPGVDPRALREAVITATTPGRATRTPDLTGAATTRALLETLVGD